MRLVDWIEESSGLDPNERPLGWKLQDVAGKKAIPYTSDGVAELLEGMDVEIRTNTRASRWEWKSGEDHPLYGWKPWTDDVESSVLNLAYISHLGVKADGSADGRVWRPTHRDWEIAWRALAGRHKVDPFIEWVQGLPEWDGAPRVELLLADLLNVDMDREIMSPHSRLVRWASRFPFVGAIERALQPGCKIDEMPVLIGNQDAGKSAFVASLLPVKEWFGDNLTLDGTGKEMAESLDGKVIVEVSEMAGSRRAEVERIKAFLTRTDDGQHRRAYARHTAPSPRRCVFMGTANDSGAGVLPRDPTGSRRFVSIQVGTAERSVEAAIDQFRNELWAEAWHKYQSREWLTGRLPRDLKDEQKRTNAPHENRDLMLDELVDRLPKKIMTMTEIAEKIGLLGDRKVLPKSEQFRLADGLTTGGWYKAQRRVGGKPTRVWTPPGEIVWPESSNPPMLLPPELPSGEDEF